MVPVPEHCDSAHSSDVAMEAWFEARARRDSVKLDHATGCLSEGCSSGTVAACGNLRGLCLMPDTQKEEALAKAGVCSMPRVTGDSAPSAK
jgi:hypothetical protein